MMRKLLVFITVWCLAAQAFAQKPTKYQLGILSQERVNRSKQPTAIGVKDAGDTTFTVYSNASVQMKLYFVNGNHFNDANPNPTGIYLNNQRFSFFCDVEKGFRQYASSFLDVYEFSFLGKQYLCLVSQRDDCKKTKKACVYRCYNVFDITSSQKITQTSFSSIFEGIESFGDFNMDGNIDFVRVLPKPLDSPPKGYIFQNDSYMITAYSFSEGKYTQLKNNNGDPIYAFAKGDQQAQQFSILKHGWAVNLKDSTGKDLQTAPYFEKYKAFDPNDRSLFTPEGMKVEKNNWALQVGKFKDEEGAKQLCSQLQKYGFPDVFIMPDQYNKDVMFYVFVGNFEAKEQAAAYQEKLKKTGMESIFRDLTSPYPGGVGVGKKEN